MVLERFQEIIVLHRGLTCQDEDASLEEQVEKIIFHYSITSRDIDHQLEIATMVEALIELTNKFSSDPIKYVTMQKKSWVFVECEPEIWLIAAYSNDNQIKDIKTAADLMVNVKAVHAFLTRIYKLYVCLNGPIHAFITGPKGSGLKIIDKMKELTKFLRKSKKKIEIMKSELNKYGTINNNKKNNINKTSKSSDFQSISDQDSSDNNNNTTTTFISDENLEENDNDYYSDEEPIELDSIQLSDAQLQEIQENLIHLQQQCKQKQIELDQLYLSSDYPMNKLKNKLSNLFVWYFTHEEYNDITFLSTFSSPSYALLKPCHRSIARLKYQLQATCPNLAIDTMIMYDHNLLWSDLSPFVTNQLISLLNRWDASFNDGIINRRMKKVYEECLRNVFHEKLNEYNCLNFEQKQKVVNALKEREDRRLNRLGVSTIANRAINIEMVTLDLQILSLQTTLTTMDYSTFSFLDGLYLDENNHLLFPLIFDENKEAIGRLMAFYHGRLCYLLVLPEEAIAEVYPKEIEYVLYQAQQNGIVSKRLCNIVDEVNKLKESPTSLPILTADDLPNPQFVRIIQAFYLFYQYFQTWKFEMDRFEIPNSYGRQSSNAMLSYAKNTPLSFGSFPKNIRSIIQPKSLTNKDSRVLVVTSDVVLAKLITVDPDKLPPSAVLLDPTLDPKYVRTLDAYLDQYIVSQSLASETSHVILHYLMSNFGQVMIKAIHDAWEKLEINLESIPMYEDQQHTLEKLHKTKKMICTRISTANRGGLWLHVERITQKQLALTIVSDCATFNDVMEDIYELHQTLMTS